MSMYLPLVNNCRNVCSVPAKSGASIGVLNFRAQGRSYEALFLCLPSFMVGVVEALRSAVPRNGNANSAASATLLIGVIGGSSLSNPRVLPCAYSVFLSVNPLLLILLLSFGEGFVMSSFKLSGTPEHYFKPGSIGDWGDLDLDALQCALGRARALTLLLGGQLDGSCDRYSDEVLVSAMWALEGLIVQAQLILDGGEE